VLRNTSLTVSAGECVAIAGPSGCGKSTLLKIMLGQLQPNEGEVLIADIPLRQLGLKNYRSLIGVVMQDDQLFAGSLSENISFFDPHVSDARVTEAATLAAIHDDIKRMPMSYHTLAGDMGSGMSGGQKQRVFLARALYKEPKLLFMDEATSHLDVKTEQVVNQAIQKLKMTRIFIAHRQQTLDSADRVIQLPSLKSLAAVPVDESIAA
jgi:ATP-binding cassette, subfamily B, bacterial CvaB/MchF/RaxB